MSDVPQLPQRVRRHRWETDTNYLQRVFAAHHFSPELGEAYLRRMRRSLGPGSDVVAALTGRRSNHSMSAAEQGVRGCATCLASLPPRWVCVRCSAGAAIPQEPNAGPFVCRKHRMWVAPGTGPGQQHQVGPDVLRADRRWQQLLTSGRANVLIQIELQRLISDWDALIGVDRTPSAQFVLLTQLWSRVATPRVLDHLTRPDELFADRVASLKEAVENLLSGETHGAPLIDGIWAMLRTTAASRRTDIPAVPTEPHLHVLPTSGKAEPSIQTFDLYYTPTSTSQVTRWDDVHQKYVLGRTDGGMRWQLTKGQMRRLHLLCDKGHSFSGAPSNRRRSYRSDSVGCPYCSGRKPIPGIRSLHVTHPARASLWHPSKNGSITPDQVLAGSNKIVWWVCGKGHEFDRAIDQFVNATNGCPICRGLRIRPGVNDLTTKHPQLAKQWHPTRNGTLGPSEVTGGSSRKVWWQCQKGHEWRAKVAARRNRGCPTCQNRTVIRGHNSLADTHPGIAAEWHSVKNGELTPDSVLAGSALAVWWLCPVGHDYKKPLVRRKAGAGCQYCVNKAVWPGFNDAATRHPDLMTDWDHDRNPDMDPTQQLPGNKPHWWRCADAGHIAFATIPNRRLTNGCPQCPKADRVGQPPTS